MGTHYYAVQILTVVETVSMLTLLKTLLYAAGSESAFRNRGKTLRAAAIVMLVSANLLLAVSRIGAYLPAGSTIGAMLASLIDFAALLIGAGALVTFIAKGKKSVLQKEKAKIVRIRAEDIELHTNIRPFPIIQAGEMEANQTGTWTDSGKRNTLIFVGGAPEKLLDGSEMIAEIVPHNEKPDTYYVTKFMIEGKKTAGSRVLGIIGTIAAAMFVLSLVLMNHDCLALGMQLPYPEGYPSISLAGSAAGTMLFRYVCTINGKARTKPGSAASTAFQMICLLLLALCCVSMCGSFVQCGSMYL